ncbi:hypothetical protein CPB84DRAFT_1786066 [Gymnopilus junonius]|uniref:TauD/TfdA-like domain-containing protein n=1 Tax=Gymnopilus junonius TaxID=109634 RepID=A0A9P5NII7_GYMJU|nr:hypothetical protein CPB84DRAFT_1786066 [Gymnopilus junonius]
MAPPSFLGSLSSFESYDTTPHVGTTFPDKSVQLSKLLAAPDSDQLIKDLATLVSHRGVVFFTDQDLDIEQQKVLATRLGELSGKPKTSKLHKHPISEETSELGTEVSVISSVGGIARPDITERSTRASTGWHSDISFEPVPSDYAILKIHTLPEVGGDTLWASGYEAYDRLSPVYKKFLEGLTAVHNADVFTRYAERKGIKIQDPRGAPENTGSDLTTIHPVVRTNPVTGFKSLYVNRGFTKRIVELTLDESTDVLNYLEHHVSENHDLQVRYRWRKNDIAIWDNRVTLHTATFDYEALRTGNRVVSLGEKPYFDPNSKSRREVLGLKVPVA